MDEPKRKGDWIQTYKGKKFWPLDPRPEEVNIEDIAHALSLICRFNGHCNEFYSVAQHSVLVSDIVRPPEAFVALLHDGAEAYLGDVTSPVKRHLPNVKEIEKRLEKIIFQHFKIENYDKEEISRADKIALYTEMRDLMSEPPEMWEEFNIYQSLLLEKRIITLDPGESERLFLEKYEALNCSGLI